MTAAFDDFGRNVLFCADERVCAEVGNAGFGVNDGVRIGRGAAAAEYHGGNAAGVGLLGQIEVGEHYVAGLMEKDVCDGNVRK